MSAGNCTHYLEELLVSFQFNRTAALATLAPFIFYSGKFPQDLGFMKSCQNLSSSAYSTVQINSPVALADEVLQLRLYQGLCFSAQCPADRLNQ